MPETEECDQQTAKNKKRVYKIPYEYITCTFKESLNYLLSINNEA